MDNAIGIFGDVIYKAPQVSINHGALSTKLSKSNKELSAENATKPVSLGKAIYKQSCKLPPSIC